MNKKISQRIIAFGLCSSFILTSIGQPYIIVKAQEVEEEKSEEVAVEEESIDVEDGVLDNSGENNEPVEESTSEGEEIVEENDDEKLDQEESDNEEVDASDDVEQEQDLVDDSEESNDTEEQEEDNENEFGTSTPSEATPIHTASTTPTSTTTDDVYSPVVSTTTATSTNLATTTDIATSTNSNATSTSNNATTTDNNVATTTSSSTPMIVSGTSVAMANVLNLVNTNLINSEGVFLFSNYFETVLGSIDFREQMNGMAKSTCVANPCTKGEEISVNVSNDAHIDNTISVHANSGKNIVDGGENASIETGDAYAGLNLINVANTNVVDSEYLVITMNAFQDVNGDFVFPNLNDFFNTLASGPSSANEIVVQGEADVENNVNMSADSGNNTIEGEGSVSTGNSHTTSNVFNKVNALDVGGRSVSILFKVNGDWAGEVFGAPPGLAWTEGDDGSIYLFDAASGSETSTTGSNANVTSSSTASIRNNVSVTALTGENEVSNSDTALISTGNAYAGANIVNVANENIVSKNWVLAVINIFGNFNGNIAFGRPDMWIGQQVETPSFIKNGSELTYKLTVINNGDSDATEISIENEFNSDYLEIIDSTHEYSSESSNKMVWRVPSMPAGAATEITYRARVKSVRAGTDIVSEVFVSERETDNNEADNRDTITVTTSSKSRSKKNKDRTEEVRSVRLSSLDLTVERTTKNSTSTPSQEIVQELIVRNNSRKDAKNVTLNDFVRDSSGKIIQHEVWDLGTVLAGEEIIIQYAIQFAENAPAGLYKLSTIFTDGTSDFIKFVDNGTIALIKEQVVVPTPLIIPPKTVASEPTPIKIETEVATTTITEYHDEPLVFSILPNIAHGDVGDGTAGAADAMRLKEPLVLLAAIISMATLYYTTRRFYDYV